MNTLLVLATLVEPGVGRPAAKPPAQIILFRHAEKPDDDNNPHLSPEGVQRAERLVTFINSNPMLTRFGAPVALFATKTTKDNNGQRTQETVAPLAKALKLEVKTPFTGNDYNKLAKLILRDPAYSGKTVLICWNHENIPQLAAALGVKPAPPKWKDKDYDRVYVITYQRGEVLLQRLTQ